jgi:uncharacterized membrane protein
VLATFGILLPYFASTLNSDRIYHISLFFLAPFFVIGFIALFDYLPKITKSQFKIKKNKLYALIGIFLAVYFLFNSALVYQAFDQPKLGRFALENNMDFPYVNEQEIQSINWISQNNINKNINIYADMNKAMFLQGFNRAEIRYYNIENAKLSYIFLGTFNIQNKKLLVPSKKFISDYINTFEFENKMSKIYDNGNGTLLTGQ